MFPATRSSAAISARKEDLRVLFIFERSFHPARILPPDKSHGVLGRGFRRHNKRIAGLPRRNGRMMKEKSGEVKKECGGEKGREEARRDGWRDGPLRSRRGIPHTVQDEERKRSTRSPWITDCRDAWRV